MFRTPFPQDERGNVAIIFSLALIPVLASVGAAVDYTRLSAVQVQLRSASDQAALAIASSDDPTRASTMLDKLRADLRQRLPDLSGITMAGSWIDSANYRVSVNATLDMAIVRAVPGMPKTASVATETVVNRIPPVYKVLPPRMSLLEPEAADYNRAYIYCFDPKKKNEPGRGRRDFVPIADNASPPTDFSKTIKDYKLPECVAGEVVAYKMRNVREARTSPSKWDTDKEYYEYFTDTEVDQNTGVVTNRYVGDYIDKNRKRTPVDLTNRPMLETILCNSEAECKPTNQGGILPTRRTNRDPATATGACSSGKLMYYGYEDRPGGDRDYDDIRIIISCPEMKKVQDKQVRIVK
jgi:hypothetical protein